MSKMVYMLQAACFIATVYLIGDLLLAGENLTAKQFGQATFGSLFLITFAVAISALHPRSAA